MSEGGGESLRGHLSISSSAPFTYSSACSIIHTGSEREPLIHKKKKSSFIKAAQVRRASERDGRKVDVEVKQKTKNKPGNRQKVSV